MPMEDKDTEMLRRASPGGFEMSWQGRLAGLALVTILAGACSGESEPLPEASAPTTTVAAPQTSEVPETVATAPTTAAPTTTAQESDDGAPQSLAFASTSDLGRLFEIQGSVTPSEIAAGDPVETTLFDGFLVQTTNLRSRDGVMWVRVNDVVSNEEFGWVPSDALRPTTETVELFDANRTSEFRQVGRTVPDDLLEIFAAAGGDGSPVGTLSETEVAMHGGNTVVTPDGQHWVDVIDTSSRSRRGWVLGEFFNPLSSVQAKAPDSTDVDRRADSEISYGGGISDGVVSALGCNAQQITFTAQSSSLGSSIVFGNVPPVGTPLDSNNTRFRWSSSGGSTVHIGPGESVTFSFPSIGTKTWYFTTLSEDGQPEYATSGGQADLDASGRALATDVQSFQVAAGSCAAPEEPAPTLDPYVYELPDDERDAALAEFEAELAAWEAANGVSSETVVEGVAEEAEADPSSEDPDADTQEGEPDA